MSADYSDNKLNYDPNSTDPEDFLDGEAIGYLNVVPITENIDTSGEKPVGFDLTEKEWTRAYWNAITNTDSLLQAFHDFTVYGFTGEALGGVSVPLSAQLKLKDAVNDADADTAPDADMAETERSEADTEETDVSEPTDLESAPEETAVEEDTEPSAASDEPATLEETETLEAGEPEPSTKQSEASDDSNRAEVTEVNEPQASTPAEDAETEADARSLNPTNCQINWHIGGTRKKRTITRENTHAASAHTEGMKTLCGIL